MVNGSPEDFGGLEAAPQPRQDAEKARDRAAKAQARAQRLGKDEGKARKHDGVLALLVASLIGDQGKAGILDAVLDALEVGIPSHLLVGSVSLSDPELSKFVRQSAGKMVQLIMVDVRPERVDFDEKHIDPQLQLRMNAWFDDIVTSLFVESSVVATQKFLDLVSARTAPAGDGDDVRPAVSHEKARACAVAVISATFSWFLDSVGMRISVRKSEAYAEFILDEIVRRAGAFLSGADKELLSGGDVDLFGI